MSKSLEVRIILCVLFSRRCVALQIDYIIDYIIYNPVERRPDRTLGYRVQLSTVLVESQAFEVISYTYLCKGYMNP